MRVTGLKDIEDDIDSDDEQINDREQKNIKVLLLSLNI
jgi:hypothetical protein